MRFKKTIGIIAIILGAYFFLCVFSLFPDAGADLTLSDTKKLHSILAIYLPFAILFTMATVIAGVVLLCLDNAVYAKPGKKSRIACILILTLSFFHLFCNIIYLILTPTSVLDYIPFHIMFMDLGAIGILILFCFLGLFIRTNKKSDSQYDEIMHLKQEIEKLKSKKEGL